MCGGEVGTDEICARLAQRRSQPAPLPAGRSFRAAAVLVPLVCLDNDWHLLLTRRTETVQTHKGQIAFPGGAVEPADRTRIDTALRETLEEIGVHQDAIEVLGLMDEMPTISGYLITPVVGVVQWPVELCLEPSEVSRVFLVPLQWLADSQNYEEVLMNLPDGRREKVVYFQPYDGEKVWGATGRITLNFLKTIGLIV